MAQQTQSKVTAVILIVVIAIAIGFIIKTAMPKHYPRPQVDWTCESCGYTFVAESQAKSRVCPQCKGEAVRTYYYYCTVHNQIFEAYRSKPNPDVSDASPERMGPPDEMMLYKMPGGEWETGYPMEITCPEGNSDPSTLKYCPPTSEYRKE